MTIRKKSPDFGLLLVTFILLAIGLVMVYSSTAVSAINTFGSSFYYLKRQVLFAMVGLIGMYICMRLNYWKWKKLIKLLFLINFLFLLVILIPGVGHTVGGATRWINLGFMRFQPSDLTKFVMVLFTANFLSLRDERVKSFSSGILPLLIVIGVTFALIMQQPDFGTGMTIIGFIGIMLFIAGASLKHLVPLAAIGLAGIPLIAKLAPYRAQRMTVFWDPWVDPLGSGYQIIQSLYAIVGGGLTGVGLGASKQKLDYLPEGQTDFIFSILIEEFGFLGGAFVIALFCFFTWRGFKIAASAPDRFSYLLAMGLTVMISFQAFINIGVATAMLPTTGLTLPLISFGGTSLLITLASIGVILNISRFSTDY
ncbi:putative lipid II flippase FtsW [Proteinivorax hydrogeniformans]|uniref:Lipid II flippase FtsW n=1 Tax=Proteinivorax hydrogeniformans TaxID=1826727 RepID=A0AAU8HQI0_9FIRM